MTSMLSGATRAPSLRSLSLFQPISSRKVVGRCPRCLYTQRGLRLTTRPTQCRTDRKITRKDKLGTSENTNRVNTQMVVDKGCKLATSGLDISVPPYLNVQVAVTTCPKDSPGPAFILYKNCTIVSPSLFCPPPSPLTQCALAFSAMIARAACTSERVITPRLTSVGGEGETGGGVGAFLNGAVLDRVVGAIGVPSSSCSSLLTPASSTGSPSTGSCFGISSDGPSVVIGTEAMCESGVGRLGVTAVGGSWSIASALSVGSGTIGMAGG